MNQEEQKAIDMITGKDVNNDPKEYEVKDTKAQSKGEFVDQTAAIAAMMQPPENATPEERERFEKLQKVAMQME